jgi:hypothetical protein
MSEIRRKTTTRSRKKWKAIVKMDQEVTFEGICKLKLEECMGINWGQSREKSLSHKIEQI